MSSRRKSARINARLDEELARQMDDLRRHTGKSTTQILKEALSHYHRQLLREGAKAADVLAEVGFVGCASGPKDLSRTYKDQLAESLGPKVSDPS